MLTAAHPYAPGGGTPPPRRDVYLYDPEQTELGIKARGLKPGLEVKGLVALLPDDVPDGPFKATRGTLDEVGLQGAHA
jgi:hypothetical protein